MYIKVEGRLLQWYKRKDEENPCLQMWQNENQAKRKAWWSKVKYVNCIFEHNEQCNQKALYNNDNNYLW